jgi:signal transduction histidine kinase
MTPAPPPEPASWLRWPAALASLFDAETAPAERAPAVAALLLQLFPGAELAACRLGAADAGHLAALDGTGKARPEWAEVLAAELAGLASAGGPVRVDGLTGWAAAAVAEDRTLGHLAVAPAGGEGDPLPAFLDNAAAHLAVRLLLEEERQQRRALEAERADAEGLATVALAADGLLHDLGNHLNRMLLQTAILQRRLPEEYGADLMIIREEGSEAAALLRPLQQRREQRRAAQTTSDLNAALREVVAGAVEPRLSLAPNLPGIRAGQGDVKRLLRLVLDALAARAPEEPVAPEVRSEMTPEGRAAVIVEDRGAPLPGAALEDPVESEEGLFAATGVIPRLAVRRLLRMTGATLRVENRPGAGVTFRINWE